MPWGCRSGQRLAGGVPRLEVHLPSRYAAAEIRLEILDPPSRHHAALAFLALHPVSFAWVLFARPGLGAAVWVPIGLMTQFPNEGFGPVVLGVLFGGAQSLPHFVLGWIARSAANAVFTRRQVTVSLAGRRLTVDGHEWVRDDEDQIERMPGELILRNGDQRLVIAGGSTALRWLEARLNESAPAPDGEGPNSATAGLPNSLILHLQTSFQSMPTSMNSANRGRNDRGRRPRIGRSSRNSATAGLADPLRLNLQSPSQAIPTSMNSATEGGTTDGGGRESAGVHGPREWTDKPLASCGAYREATCQPRDEDRGRRTTMVRSSRNSATSGLMDP